MISVLLCGGRGTRLWPLSTAKKPKQFQKLVSEKSLLQETYERMNALTPQSVFVCGLQEHESLIRNELPHLAPHQYIFQPQAHDSALGVAYALMALRPHVSLDEMLVFVPTDHCIYPNDVFLQSFAKLTQSTESSQGLFTLGIRPHEASTRYGYIQTKESKNSVRPVERFIEKPSKEEAEKLTKDPLVFWNSGCIAGTLERFLDAFTSLAPAYLEAYSNPEHINTLEKTSFDYLIWEHYSPIFCIEGTGFHWNDIGTWGAFFEEKKNTQTQRTYSYNNTPILLCGIDNISVIHSDEGILVFPNNNESEIKSSVKKLYGDTF